MRFLFVNWEGGGTVPPELGVARRLAGRGHEIAVLADATIEPEARAAGCDFVPWATAPCRTTRTAESDIMRDWETSNPITMIARARERFIAGPAPRYAADTVAAIERFAPDAVAVDSMLFGALIGAQSTGVPTAALMSNLYVLPRASAPMIGTGVPTARGPLGRARDRVLARVLNRLMDASKRGINETRAAHGLQPLRHVMDQALEVDAVLVLTSRHLDRLGGAPPHVRWVGAQLDDPAWVQPWSPPWPAGNDDPIVLVALSSTYQAQEDVLRSAVAALATRPVRAVVTLGPALADLVLDAPSHVVVVQSVPHNEVLREAAALISHCGHGTAVKALGAGVPVVGLPMGRDQGDTAQRIAELGAGVRISRKASPDRIGRALDEVLGNGRFRAAARDLAARMADETREDLAVRELEALAVGAVAS
jgi:MGT family glycosyltransferase